MSDLEGRLAQYFKDNAADQMGSIDIDAAFARQKALAAIAPFAAPPRRRFTLPVLAAAVVAMQS